MEKIDSVFSNQRLPFGRFVFFAANWKFLAILSLLMILIGVWLDKVFGMTWLARSGALMTTFALFQLWLSFRYLSYKEDVTPLREKYIPVGSGKWSDAEWELHIKATNPSMTDGTIKSAAKKLRAISEKIEMDLPRLSRVTVDLVEYQLAIAALGTIVWAFGDLFANQLLHCGAWTC
jgi:hypothetical protein